MRVDQQQPCDRPHQWVRRWGLWILALGCLLCPWPNWNQGSMGSVQAQPTDDTSLTIRNGAPFVVYIYIQGIRVGWIRPRHTGVIRGLTPGKHRVLARSYGGATSWGPKSIQVPGTWNLRVRK